MISYLGVTIDELVQAMESSLAFTDDREGRSLEEPISFEDDIEEEEAAELADAENEAEELELDDAELEDEEEFEDDELTDIFIDEGGMLHTFGPTLPLAADSTIEFLTDYMIADDIDDSWLSLDQARGALLALKVLLPILEDMPEIESAYSFTIARDPSSGLPSSISMKSVNEESAEVSLVRTEASYEGVVKDSTILVDLFETAGIPADEKEYLLEILSEAIFDLAEEQCGIVVDVHAFTKALAELTSDPQRLDAAVEAPSEPAH